MWRVKRNGPPSSTRARTCGRTASSPGLPHRRYVSSLFVRVVFVDFIGEQVLEHSTSLHTYQDIQDKYLSLGFLGRQAWKEGPLSPNHRMYTAVTWAKQRARRDKSAADWTKSKLEEKSTDEWYVPAASIFFGIHIDAYTTFLVGLPITQGGRNSCYLRMQFFVRTGFVSGASRVGDHSIRWRSFPLSLIILYWQSAPSCSSLLLLWIDKRQKNVQHSQSTRFTPDCSRTSTDTTASIRTTHGSLLYTYGYMVPVSLAPSYTHSSNSDRFP